MIKNKKRSVQIWQKTHVGLTGTLKAWLIDTHAKLNVVLSFVVYVQKANLSTL